jgi:hypothetical protein
MPSSEKWQVFINGSCKGEPYERKKWPWANLRKEGGEE